MALVTISNVEVLDNPSPFLNPFQFEITFECAQSFDTDLEWKIIYVGSAESEQADQELGSVLIGPLKEGTHKFVFQVDHPNPALIPPEDAVGPSVVLIQAAYGEHVFVRVGYFINNYYPDEEGHGGAGEEGLPVVHKGPVRFDQLWRNIQHEMPRVTTFNINWDDPQAPLPIPREIYDVQVPEHENDDLMPLKEEEMEEEEEDDDEAAERPADDDDAMMAEDMDEDEDDEEIGTDDTDSDGTDMEGQPGSDAIEAEAMVA